MYRWVEIVLFDLSVWVRLVVLYVRLWVLCLQEEQHQLKNELAELAITLNMVAQKGRVQHFEYDRSVTMNTASPHAPPPPPTPFPSPPPFPSPAPFSQPKLQALVYDILPPRKVPKSDARSVLPAVTFGQCHC